jgi:uncharacterized protein DUF6265
MGGIMRVLVWLPAALLLDASAPLPRDPAFPSRVSELSWLEGVWRGRIGTRDFEAHYTGPEGGVILSASKYTANGKAAGFEFERFEVKEGTVMLTPYPEGRSSVSFRLASHDEKARRAVFENPAHDFPTRISYQRVAEDSLTILVSGPGKDGRESVLRYELGRYGGTAVRR